MESKYVIVDNILGDYYHVIVGGDTPSEATQNVHKNAGFLNLSDYSILTYESYLETEHYSQVEGQIEYGKLKETRDKDVKAITVEVDGLVFNGDEESQNRMSRAVAAAEDLDETIFWKLANNTVHEVTAAQLKSALRLAGRRQTQLWMI